MQFLFRNKEKTFRLSCLFYKGPHQFRVADLRDEMFLCLSYCLRSCVYLNSLYEKFVFLFTDHTHCAAVHICTSLLFSHVYSFAIVRASCRGRDSVVDIATSYGLDDRPVGVRVPVGSKLFSTLCRPALGPNQPPIQWVAGTLSPGVKRPGREADHSRTSAKFKKISKYTSIHPYAFMV
jgi:hypothetical protein